MLHHRGTLCITERVLLLERSAGAPHAKKVQSKMAHTRKAHTKMTHNYNGTTEARYNERVLLLERSAGAPP